MNEFHTVSVKEINSEIIRMEIDGKELTFSVSKISPRLSQASEEQLKNFEVSSSGYGIHWPSIDEDISIDGLLGVKHRPPTEPSQNRGSHSTQRK